MRRRVFPDFEFNSFRDNYRLLIFYFTFAHIKNKLMKYFNLFLVLFVFASCGTPKFKQPENVTEVLKLAGDNKAELEKVIQHYKETGEVIKEEAAYFLIGNMKDHSYVKYQLVDTAGNAVGFKVLTYPDYNQMVAGWDSVESKIGNIHYKTDTIIKDYNVITADYLIKNIDLAIEAWDNNPWSKRLSFDQFCEYVLPYRGSSEPLDEWRPYFIKEFKWLKDSLNDPTNPVEAATLINNSIKSWFRFDPIYYRHPTDQGIAEMLESKAGRCEDMTNLAIFAMRANGVPVMSDFTPYWANSGNNHAWNATLNKKDSVIIFMGGEANPGEYKLGGKLAKVYRKTFAIQKSSLAERKDEWEKAPPYLGSSDIKDVTADYVPVKNIKIKLTEELPDSTKYAYVCVFNSGEWKAIDFGRVYNKKVSFYNVGMDIAYLPAFYIDGSIIPAGNAFILTDSGKTDYKKPDLKNTVTLNLISTTRKVTKDATDTSEKTFFKKNKYYTLYYWDNKWVESGKRKTGDGPLVFKDVPSNAIYWLVEDNSRKEERIFTIGENGNQIWW